MKKFVVFLTAIAFLLFSATGVMAATLPDYIGNLPVTGGDYWFVGTSSAADSDSNPADAMIHSYEFPFATINKAIDTATAKSGTYPGDVIVILPGHAETIDTTGEFDPNVAGLYFYGCGTGDGRPTFTINHTSSSFLTAPAINVSGADSTFENIIFKATYDDANATADMCELFDIAADDITFKECYFWVADDGTEDIIHVDDDNTADNLVFEDCIFQGYSTGSRAAIYVDDTQDGLAIRNCDFFGSYSVAPIYADEAMTNTVIKDCQIENDAAGAYAVEMTHTSNTGYFTNNVLYTDDRATAYDCDDMWMFGNQFSMGIDLPAIPIPALGPTLGTDRIVVYTQSGSTTTVVDETLCGYPNDYFNTGWQATVIQDTAGASGAPQGETRDISDFVSATGTVTVSPAFSVAPGAADVVLLHFNPEAIANDPFDDHVNYFLVDPNMGETNNSSVASHEVATVTGTVRLKILIECTKTCTDAADSARFDFGTASDSNSIISNAGAAGKASETITAGYFIVDGSPGEDYAVASSSAILDYIIYNGEDVGYTISGEALTAGIIKFHVWWTPLSDGATVTEGALGTL